MEKLSAYILTKDSEGHLPEVLGCLSSVADEVVVVDSGSTDRTESIAGTFANARFVYQPFTNFKDQRNIAAENCRHEMVLFLDSDEIPDEKFLESVAALKQTGFPHDAYCAPRRWNVLGKDVHCIYPICSPDNPIRLFRKSKVDYNNSSFVHESPKGFHTVGEIDGCISHVTMVTREELRSKLDLYTDLAARDLLRKEKRVNVYKMLFSPICAFFKWYFLKGGYKDGFTGLYLGMYAYRYTLDKYLKAIQLK